MWEICINAYLREQKQHFEAMEHYKRLLVAIGKTFGKTPQAHIDYEELSNHVFSRTHKRLSPTTLKRLFGYLNEPVTPQSNTLHTLARYVGYADYDTFLRSTTEAAEEVQSQIIENHRIVAAELPVDARLRLTWQPDRLCVVRHLGEARFEIEECVNAKLSAGDTFTCHLFIAHEPLYLDQLIHLDAPPLTYVCGKRYGVTFEVLEEKA